MDIPLAPSRPSVSWWRSGPLMAGQGCPRSSGTRGPWKAGKCDPSPWSPDCGLHGTGHCWLLALAAWWPWPWIHSGHGCLVAPAMAAQWSRVLVVPFPHTSSSRRRCSSSWLVPVSPSTAGLPAPGASATLSDIAAAGDTGHDGVPAGPWLVASGLRHPQALHSPALPYLASDVPSPVPVRCHLPGRTGLRRGKEPRKTPRAES